MLCLSLSIRAVVRALFAFLSCSRLHFIYAYCTVFNKRINDDNDDDKPMNFNTSTRVISQHNESNLRWKKIF